MRSPLPNPEDSIPELIRPQLMRTYNLVKARNTTTYAQRTTDVTQRVDAHLSSVSGGIKTLIDFGGPSDITQSGMDGPTAFSTAETYWAARIAAGFDQIISFTWIDHAGYNLAGEITARDYVNTQIMAKADAWFHAVDLRTVSNGDFMDHTNATNFPDTFHFNDVLAAVAADELLPVYLATL